MNSTPLLTAARLSRVGGTERMKLLRPNQSIERNASGALRAPSASAHLQRYASASKKLGRSVSRASSGAVRVKCVAARGGSAGVVACRGLRRVGRWQRGQAVGVGAVAVFRVLSAPPIAGRARALAQVAASAHARSSSVVGATHNKPIERTAFGVRSSAR
jgi:hypothetical protein